MRILIIHAYTPANIGDGAIVLAMISEARRVFGDSVEVSVSATDPAAFEKYLSLPSHGRLLAWHSMGSSRARLAWVARNLPSILLLWWGTRSGRARLRRIARSHFLAPDTREAVSAYLQADLVLAAGGSYLGDSFRRQLPFWHLEYRCAASAGLPLVFFSQSVNSAESRVTKVFLKKLLERSALFIARDRQSLDRLRSVGPFESKLALCPDVALLAGRPAAGASRSPNSTPCVGVSLMKWQNYRGDVSNSHAAYMTSMQEALERLLVAESGLRVRLYATNAPLGMNAMDDVAVVSEMHRRLAERGFADRCEIFEWNPSPDVFMRDAAKCDLFVATRMHSAVLALNAGVPVAGVAYEEKMRGLLEMFELGEYVVDIEAPGSIPDLVQRAYDRRGDMRKTVERVGPEIRERASRAMDLTARVVAGGGQAD
jgi:colanic acid/amylovoran biosynthesis protein